MKTIQKLFCYSLFTGLVLCFLVPNNAWGRNYVKIATIGAPSPHLDLDQEPQELVNEMIEFWGNELAPVLPDKPDLIVLPEVCDRPAGMNIDLQLKYFKVRGDQVMEYFKTVARDNECYIAFGAKHQQEFPYYRGNGSRY
jgi:predicted amidohydrolase